MNATSLRKLAWRRGAGALGLAVLALALPACKSGSSQANRPSVSTEIVGVGGGNGPDNTGGTGGTNPITGQQNPNDVVLASDQVLLVVDGVGRDQTTAQLAAGGTPFQTIIGPTGGNIIDLEVPGLPNDQMGISGVVATGIVNIGNPANPSDDVRNNPFNNIIANFEIIPDTSPDIVGAFGDLGLNSAGLPTDLTSPAARRLVVRGVILNTSGTADCTMPETITGRVDFVGSQTLTVSQIQASGVGAEVPSRFFENLVGGTPVVANSRGLPLIVTTVYTLHRSPSRFVSLSTTIVNPTTAAGGVPDPVFVNQIVQLIQTGADSRNLDIFVPAPTFFTPMATLLPFPTGIAPYLTIVGRDEPGVSYTLWDTIVGQILTQRIGGVAAGGGQIPRTNPGPAVGSIPTRGALPITPLGTSPGPLNWIRHIAVGERNDVEASARIAIREIQRSPLRFVPGTSPAQPLPNGVTALVELGGQIEGGGANDALIQVFEISPAIFLNPLTGTLQPSAAPILRTTVRTNPTTGDWLTMVPAGFSIPDVVDPSTGAVVVDNSSLRTGTSRYGIRVLLPGRAPIPPTPGDFAAIVDVARGNEVFDEPLYHARPIFVNEGLGASVSFVVQDENGLPLPAKITVKGISGTPNPEIGLPNGLGAFSLDPTTGNAVPVDAGVTLERASGAGNVVYSLSGNGTINLPIPPPLTSATYEIIASHGTEYEIEGSGASGVQQITVAPNDVASTMFTLRQVANLPRRAISGD
ncbi:MAG: hypothetical protein L0206_18165, partial [Actinobacteria bacterium]|nr:hypothetical protein [Actinomycetota bacterium]